MNGLRLAARQARRVLRDAAAIPAQTSQAVLKKLDAHLWERTRYRPAFNADSFQTAFPETACNGTGAITGGRLAIRIAFHFVPSRLKYLTETVDAIRGFPFREIDIFVDTNSPEFAERIGEYVPGVTCCVWTELEHPFKLTWVHRQAMLEQAEDYDTFAYVEDDIAIPRSAMRRWLEEYERLAPHGHLPGFLRVERSKDGTLFLSDFRAPVGRDLVIEIDGRQYLDTPYPYQGCWFCHKAEFDAFTRCDSFLSGATLTPAMIARDSGLGVREQVAVGPAFDDIPPGRNSRMLVPLDSTGNIAADTLIAHIPSNYARLKTPHPAMIGTVRLDQAFSD